MQVRSNVDNTSKAVSGTSVAATWLYFSGISQAVCQDTISRTEQKGAPQGQTPLARYFPSLPAKNSTENTTTRRVSSPARDVLLQTLVAGPSTIEAEPYNDELSAENLAVANQQEYTPDWTRQENREEDSMESGNDNVNYS